jgi:anti-anti-sigma factor
MNFQLTTLAGTRRMSVGGFPKHLIFYQLQESEILVLRVVHGARDLEGLFLTLKQEEQRNAQLLLFCAFFVPVFIVLKTYSGILGLTTDTAARHLCVGLFQSDCHDMRKRTLFRMYVPMLRVEVHALPQAATLRCIGRIVLGVECETLRCMTEARTEASLILDLAQVRAMDAAGLGLLAELHCTTLRRNQALRIVHASRPVCVLMAMTNLHSALNVSDCEEAELDPDGTGPSLVGRYMSA